MLREELEPRIARPGSAGYPRSAGERLGSAAPESLTVIGDPGLLRLDLLAWLSSSALPAELVLPAYDVARRLRDAGVPVISGFQSAIERDCLTILLRGDQPIVIAPARGIDRMRIPEAWRGAIDAGRLAIVSGTDRRVTRPTARTAEARNRTVAALARRVFIAAGTAGGRLQSLARTVAARGQPLSCFDHPANHDLLLLGARPVDPRAASG